MNTNMPKDVAEEPQDLLGDEDVTQSDLPLFVQTHYLERKLVLDWMASYRVALANLMDAVERIIREPKKHVYLSLKKEVDEKNFETVMRALGNVIDKWINDQVKKIVGIQTRNAWETKLNALEQWLDVGLTIDERDNDVINFLDAHGAELVTNVGEDIKVGISNQLTEGILNNESIGQMVGRLQQVFTGSWTRMERIARTETAAAMAEAELNNYEKLDIERVQWVYVSDNRLCDICRDAARGKLRETSNPKDEPVQIGTLDGIYNLVDVRGAIPYRTHPNCRCELVPIIQELELI